MKMKDKYAFTGSAVIRVDEAVNIKPAIFTCDDPQGSVATLLTTYVKLYIDNRNIGKTVNKSISAFPVWNQTFTVQVQNGKTLKFCIFQQKNSGKHPLAAKGEIGFRLLTQKVNCNFEEHWLDLKPIGQLKIAIKLCAGRSDSIDRNGIALANRKERRKLSQARHRDSVATSFEALRALLPDPQNIRELLPQMKGKSRSTGSRALKYNKIGVLTRAKDYVSHLECMVGVLLKEKNEKMVESLIERGDYSCSKQITYQSSHGKQEYQLGNLDEVRMHFLSNYMDDKPCLHHNFDDIFVIDSNGSSSGYIKSNESTEATSETGMLNNQEPKFSLIKGEWDAPESTTMVDQGCFSNGSQESLLSREASASQCTSASVDLGFFSNGSQESLVSKVDVSQGNHSFI